MPITLKREMINIHRKSAVAAIGIAFGFIVVWGMIDPGADTAAFAGAENKNFVPDSVDRENRNKIRLYFRSNKITYSNASLFGDDLSQLGIKCGSEYDTFQIERIKLIGFSSRSYYYHVFCSGYAKCDNKYDRFRYTVYIEKPSGKIVIQKREKIHIGDP